MKRITLNDVRRAVEAQPDAATRGLVERALMIPAFDLVKNSRDWKAPIMRDVRLAHCDYEPEVIAHAIGFFTATTAKVEISADGEIATFTADGYRAGPAN